MYFINLALVTFVKILARAEIPAWGYFYNNLIKRFVSDDFWGKMGPRVIRDKRKKMFFLLDTREWADRLFFLLGRWYDLETLLVMELICEEGDNIADVGANYGNFSIVASTLIGKTASIVAFEPNPKAFARLRTNVDMNRLSNIRLVNAGLSDKIGTLVLNVPRHNPGEASFANVEGSDSETFECAVKTGDEEFADLTVACIKIDVEGFEVRVLDGFKTVIERDRPWIITEVVRTHLQRDGHLPEDLGEVLDPYGYTPYRIGFSGIGKWKKISFYPCNLATEEESDILWVPEARQNTLRASGVLAT